MIYIDIAPKSSFHPRYRIFPCQPFSSTRARALSLLYYTSAAYSPRHRRHPRGTLYTKQSNLEPVARTTAAPTRDCIRWQFIYPGYLCNNLLTRYIFFARARRRFHGFVSPRLVTARESHCCATVRKIAPVRIHSNAASRARILFLLTTPSFV